MTDDSEAFTETMMKDGGRLQALSFHYYAMPHGSRAQGPATGFPRRANGPPTLQLALNMDGIVSKVSRDHGQV